MRSFRVLAVLGLLGAIAPAHAGPYTDDLSRCLVEKSTAADKSMLVQWIFVAMAQHPSVKSLTRIGSEDIEKHNKATAELFAKLLTETCLDDSRKAMKFEGATAIQQSFQVLGQVAAREIFSHPDVASMMSGLDKYVDKSKFESLAQ
jgi:hypothetical protein